MSQGIYFIKNSLFRLRKSKRAIFALLMSFNTALASSILITFTNHILNKNFFFVWFPAFLTAWPIVFLVIIVMAPRIQKITNSLID